MVLGIAINTVNENTNYLVSIYLITTVKVKRDQSYHKNIR